MAKIIFQSKLLIYEKYMQITQKERRCILKGEHQLYSFLLPLQIETLTYHIT